MKKFFTTTILVINSLLYSQVGIGTEQPHPSAILDLTANNKGFLPPRLTTAQRDSIQNPAQGLMVYNTDTDCLHYWDNISWAENCADTQNSGETGIVTSLACLRTSHQGSLNAGYAANGATSTIPYIGGNGGNYNFVTVNSTGVTGLTATLLPGNLNNDGGVFIFNITGTPSSIGMATFEVKILGHTCTFSRPVLDVAPDNFLRFATHRVNIPGGGGAALFNGQLTNQNNYGPSGIYNKIDGIKLFDISYMITNEQLTGAQLKIGYDVINVLDTQFSEHTLQVFKDYVDLGGVLVIYTAMVNTSSLSLLNLFGVSGTVNNLSGYYYTSNATNYLSNVFGDTRDVTVRARNKGTRILESQLPPGSTIFASETISGNVPANTAAVFTIGGYEGRVIGVIESSMYMDIDFHPINGGPIDTDQEKFLHNIVAYSIDKALGY